MAKPMEYTKGEWKKQGNRIEVYGRGVICECPSPQSGGVFELVANTNLIAAAPDMYEVFKVATGQLNSTGVVAVRTLRKMNETLGKAEGK